MTVTRVRLAAVMALGLAISACTDGEHGHDFDDRSHIAINLVCSGGLRSHVRRALPGNTSHGAQLVIDRVEVLSNSTVVSGHLINGSLLELRVGRVEEPDGSLLTLRTTVHISTNLEDSRIELAMNTKIATGRDKPRQLSVPASTYAESGEL